MKVELFELEPWSSRRVWQIVIDDEWVSRAFEESEKAMLKRRLSERVIDYLHEKHGESGWREQWEGLRSRMDEICTVWERL